jgi:hypothetical protein
MKAGRFTVLSGLLRPGQVHLRFARRGRTPLRFARPGRRSNSRRFGCAAPAQAAKAVPALTKTTAVAVLFFIQILLGWIVFFRWNRWPTASI